MHKQMYTILDDLYTGLRDRLLEGFLRCPRLQPAFGYMMAARTRALVMPAQGQLVAGLQSGDHVIYQIVTSM
jgi:hypothetical protein